MERTNHEYIRRINRVIDHIQSNLDKSFHLNELARIACFSNFHFHRIFRAIMRETLNNFTNRLRLEKSVRLLRDSDTSITELSFECGFSSSQTLSRAFKNTYGLSPREYRKRGMPEISKIRKEFLLESGYILPMTEDQLVTAFPVEVKELPSWNIAYIRILNSFEGDRVLNAFRRIIDWATQNGLLGTGTLLGSSIDDPTICPRHLCRYDAGLTVDADVKLPEDMSMNLIPARTYVSTRVSGDIRTVATAWEYLFRGWLVRSNYEPVHAPAFEIFLDKENALDWSHCELELYLPIRTLQETSGN